MQILHHFGQVTDGLQQIIRHIAWKIGDEPNSLDALNVVKLSQQFGQANETTVFGVFVAVDCLSQERDFPDALICQNSCFFENMCWRTTLLRTASYWHHAIGAELIAADHDADKGLERSRAHFRIAQRVVALKAVRNL